MFDEVTHRKAQSVINFVLFAIAYYLPCLLDASLPVMHDGSVDAILSSAISNSTIQTGLLRTIAIHLCLLIACYLFIMWIARNAAEILNLRLWISRLTFLSAGWALLLNGNGIIFPLSNYSETLQTPARWALLSLAAIVMVFGLVVTLANTLHRTQPKRVALGVVLIAASGFVATQVRLNGARAATPTVRNVILVGIDSLSDQMATTMLPNMPHLAALLEPSERFKRAYTPLGRTFPAWTSILSGELPAVHGALFNLRSLAHVHKNHLVTQELQKAGYHTVFAMDERRFANIDESFGFDRAVGPKEGALDFVLQNINDTPLTNLLLQLPVAHYLLPYSRLNVDSVPNYDSTGFVNATLAATASGRKPLFLAVHFETAHFPYKTRHAVRTFHDADPFVAEQKTALTVVDAQIGQLMAGLRRRGDLNNAMVIVLSDHGEGLGELEATTTQGGKPYQVIGYGHGANLLSEDENRVVLGLLRFVDGKPVNKPSTRTDQVSLTDLRGVIEHYVKSGEVSLPEHGGCMTVETGIRVLAASSYEGLDPAKVAAEAAGFYEISPQGLLHLRENRLAGLVAKKDVGWRCRDRLTFYSSAARRYFAYQILDDGTRLVETEPAADDVARIVAYREQLKEAAGG